MNAMPVTRESHDVGIDSPKTTPTPTPISVIAVKAKVAPTKIAMDCLLAAVRPRTASWVLSPTSIINKKPKEVMAIQKLIGNCLR